MRFLIGLRAFLLIAMLMFLITAVFPGGSAATEAAALSSSVDTTDVLANVDTLKAELQNNEAESAS